MKSIYLFLLPLLLIGCQQPKEKAQASEEAPRQLITAGGTITEIVHELGFRKQIIATDITSTYPASMQELPSIGYRNQIKAEGILSLGANVVLAEADYLNPEVIEQLKSAQVEVHIFGKPLKVEETYQLIDDLSGYLEVPDKGKQLKEELQQDIQALESYIGAHPKKAKIAFVMARGPETVFLAGEETFAEELFELAGLENTARGFKDFVPLSPEALISMNPEYLLLFESGLATLGGKDGVSNIKGITETVAYKEGNIIAMDGHYISGFGPRVGEAALELAKAINEE
jgi:iron complex transport system substrate-binding protein